MAPGIRRFAAVAAVISIAAGVGAFALACSSSSPVALPQGEDGSTGQEADAPATSDVAESGDETSTPDGFAGGDSGDAASDAPAGDAATGDGPDA